jgi:hypothetical protein
LEIYLRRKKVRRRKVKIYIVTSLERGFIMDPATCSPSWPTAVPRIVQILSYVSEQVFGIEQNNEAQIASRREKQLLCD